MTPIDAHHSSSHGQILLLTAVYINAAGDLVMWPAVFTSKVGNEFAVALVAVSLYPLLIEATKTLQGRDKVRV